jgi:GDPmannose 4,6-dehydratase
MGSNIIVTGSDGQAGQFMIKYLQDQHPEYNLIATRRHKTNPTTKLIYNPGKVKYELMDLGDTHSITELVVKYQPAYFINFAANSFVGNSWEVPVQHIQHNSIGVLHQLEAIRKHSPHTRYLNSGSSEEFGCISKRGRQDESTTIAPKSPYGVSKACAHYLVDVYRKSYNLFAVQNWTFNFESEIRGEQFVTKKVTLGTARIKKAILNDAVFEPIELGNLDSFRSWQFCGDIVDAVWKTLNNNQPKDYVISNPECHSIRELVETSFKHAGIDGYWLNNVYIYKGMELVKTNPMYIRPSDVTYLTGDSTLIERELGWKSTLTFDQLIKRMVEYDIES